MSRRGVLPGFPLQLLEGSSGYPTLLVDGPGASLLDPARTPGTDRLLIVLSDDPARLERLARFPDSTAGLRVRSILGQIDEPPLVDGSLGAIVVFRDSPVSAALARRYLRLLRPNGRFVEIVTRPSTSAPAGRDPAVTYVRPSAGSQYFASADRGLRGRPFAALQLGRARGLRLAVERMGLGGQVGIFVESQAGARRPLEAPVALADPAVYVSRGRVALLMTAGSDAVVVKLPLAGSVARLLEHQTRTLVRLAGLDGSGPVPRVLDQGVSAGQAYWVESRLPGRAATRSGWRPGRRARITRAAFEFLARLHRSTADPTRLDDRELDRLIAPLAAVVGPAARHVAPACDLEPALREIRSVFAGRRLPLVQTHGDFWRGNVMVGPSGELTGVIDWSDATERGWPMLDLLHLIVTRRKWRAFHHFGAVVNRTLMPVRLRSAERAMLAEYREGLGIPAGLWRGFVGLYWLQRAAQHLGEGHEGCEPWIRRNVVRTLPVLLGGLRGDRSPGGL